MGAGIRGEGGNALLYRSPDLRHWEYLLPLCSTERHDPDGVLSGSMWECPDFFALEDRQVLLQPAPDGGCGVAVRRTERQCGRGVTGQHSKRAPAAARCLADVVNLVSVERTRGRSRRRPDH